ncbi:hypothetical protein [Aeromonas sp. MR7]|uniref:hypothetical protein n=1 Tax=Aeromonas sp. MR7 TaxID=2923419 RepID=UPI001F4A556A|nr:hypothetical protein [Aeromonas sp. MR7]MCH7349243.1 hypothetical protein [Aeromonas sp. MR7]
MATLNSKQTESNNKPLLPLEYCSPGRAAKLLGCEVEDIYHWADVGAINLYAQFRDRDISDGETYLVGEVYSNEDLITYEERRDVEYEYDGNKYLKSMVVSEEGAIHVTPKVLYSNAKLFKFGAAIRLMDPAVNLQDCFVDISGFWKISKFNFIQEQYAKSIDENTSWFLSANYIGDESSPEDTFGIDLIAAEIPNMSSRIRVMREDLLKMHHHITTGEMMSKNENVFDSEKMHLLQMNVNPAISNERVTSKQCGFIVELLRSYGLDDTDFQGSIGELRNKIASRVPGVGDPDIDDNTLINWLKKGGVR